MVICPQCNIEHEEGEEFCKKCGKFLLALEDPVVEGKNGKGKLSCPRCKLPYEKGKYCRKCGSLLIQGISSQGKDFQPLGKNIFKKRVKEWLRMYREEGELKACLTKLEAQRENISNDIFHPLFSRYQHRLESLLPRHQEIEAEMLSIRKRGTEEIDLLKKELEPIQKRLEEYKSLHRAGAITKIDFIKEKKGLKKELKFREKNFKKHRQILSLLPMNMEGRIAIPRQGRNLLRPFMLVAFSVLLILIGVGGYFLLQGHSYPFSSLNFKKISISPPSPTPPPLTKLAAETQEVDKINTLFDNIRNANLHKNIDLFMSCFSSDFNGREKKRSDTLKMWKNFNYLDLTYEMKNKNISEDTSSVRLEWLLKTTKKGSKKVEEGRTLLDVTLKREDGYWKIKEIKSIS